MDADVFLPYHEFERPFLYVSAKYKDVIYWSTDELNEFKMNTRSLIEYLSLNEQDLHKIKNVFGLEKHLSAQLSFEYMQRRIIFKRAVLKEARRQRSRPPSHVDADILARKSETYSSWAREKARTSALVLLLELPLQLNIASYYCFKGFETQDVHTFDVCKILVIEITLAMCKYYKYKLM